MYNLYVNESPPLSAPNPFSAKRLRPGVIPFLFPPDMDWSKLDRRLGENRYRGQIVGPHGTGKSTLFADWKARLARQGWNVVTIRMHGALDRQQRRQDLLKLVSSLLSVNPPRPNTIVFIDGYEQLARWQRVCVQSWLRIRAAGLVVTTHDDLGLPTLFRTQSNVELAGQVADRIAHAANVGAVAPPAEVVDRLWNEHSGDIRETLFSLYDWYESHVQAIATPAKSA